ncbi:MAG TPA: F0F1 ATP synthase subunit delta [Balneolaceae bacterium]|nr:F0F1 ATP synthase subunit delta [Balneolaceae bacterium]
MQIDWFTFFAQVINFLILIWLLHRFLYKPVIKAMDQREKTIASELEEARLKKVEAEQTEHEYRQKVKDIEVRREQLLDDAQREASEKRKELMEEIRTEISDIKKTWEEAVESEKEAFLSQLKQETSMQVITLIDNILLDLANRNLQDQTTNIFFERLQKLDHDDLIRLQEAISGMQEAKAEVYSSFELTGEQKHRLTDQLRNISETELELEFVFEDNLGFGMEIRIGGWNIGWNLKRYLETLRSDMEHFFMEQTPADKMPELK